jgi:hypothetical protein
MSLSVEPPLRAESIYNLAFLQRPTTAIVTHNSGVDTNATECSIVDEQDGSSMSSGDGDGGGGGADVWVNDNDEEIKSRDIEVLSSSDESSMLPVKKSSVHLCAAVDSMTGTTNSAFLPRREPNKKGPEVETDHHDCCLPRYVRCEESEFRRIKKFSRSIFRLCFSKVPVRLQRWSSRRSRDEREQHTLGVNRSLSPG